MNSHRPHPSPPDLSGAVGRSGPDGGHLEDTTGAGRARPVVAIKGRGAITRTPHRFERDAREAFDDGWSAPTPGSD